MRSANLSGPLKGYCPNNALLGLTQATGLAGGFDSYRDAPFGAGRFGYVGIIPRRRT